MGPRLVSLVLAAGALLLPSCGGEPARPVPVAEQPRRPDKARAFGSPLLVPTRDGERIRQEVARAAEIERAARALPGVAEVRADVELPDRCDRPASVAVVYTGPARHRDAIERIAAGVVPEAAADRIVVEGTEPASAAERAPGPPLPLLAALFVAFGASLGVLGERARALASRRR